MRIGIISGSHRPKSRSGHTARFLAQILKSRGTEVYVLDLGRTPLPLWDESVWEKSDRPWNETWAAASVALTACDGFVVVSPEWGGMVPPALKNMFLLCSKKELAHKPGLIVAVSSGKGGSYPVAELRMSSYKNTYLNYLPEHVIIRDVENVLNTESPKDEADTLTRQRLEYSVDLLLLYAKAMGSIRISDLVVNSPYANGM